MSTDLQVVNKALRHLGQFPIENLAENTSAVSRAMKDGLADSIKGVLSNYNWTANRVSEESTGTLITPTDAHWVYRHDITALSATMDSLISVKTGSGDYTYDFQVVGDILDTIEEIITITYTKVITTVADVPEYLASLIAAHLAMESCMVITGDGNKYYAMERIYARELTRARSQELRMNPHGLEWMDDNNSSFLCAHHHSLDPL